MISKSQDYCEFIQNIQNYQDSVKLKFNGDYDIIDFTTFDIHTYLSYFDNVVIEKEFNIDVYFFDNFLDGNPYLYALTESQKLDDKNKRSLYNFLNKAEFRAKNHIIPKDSEKGFLQYLFFSEMGEQFALKWHSNYNHKRIICSTEVLTNVIDKLSKSDMFTADSLGLIKLKNISPEIMIERNNKEYTITWIENRTHSGIFRCSYRISRNSPYEINKTKEKELLDININFLY
jgi:hypothetical protein